MPGTRFLYLLRPMSYAELRRLAPSLGNAHLRVLIALHPDMYMLQRDIVDDIGMNRTTAAQALNDLVSSEIVTRHRRKDVYD